MYTAPHIVVVDDEENYRQLTLMILNKLELGRVRGVGSVSDLLMYIAENLQKGNPVDLVLMDVNMPGVNGIEGCRQVLEIPLCKDIPILMLTAVSNTDILEKAFEAGAMDYILKSSSPMELSARVKATLRLKREMDQRKARESELLQLTRKLMQQKEELKSEVLRVTRSGTTNSFIDAPTGIYNSTAFERILDEQWNKAYAGKTPVSLLLISLDFFEEYYVHYGKAESESLLRKVVKLLPPNTTSSFVARYDKSVFSVLLSHESELDARVLADEIHQKTKQLYLPHETSEIDTVVTVSVGLTSLYPHKQPNPLNFLKLAYQGLTEARKQGYDQVVQQSRLQESGPFKFISNG